jgi:hypothetical protein
MNLEDQVKLHKEISKKIDELESQKKELGLAIMQQMTSKAMSIPGFLVKLCSRLSIKLTIEEARELSAIKMSETVDKDKIKFLYNNGHCINGVNEIQYIQVSSITKDP